MTPPHLLRRYSPGRSRRFVAALASFTLAISGVLIVLAAPATADGTTRAFTPAFTANATGDITIRGNTLETCVAGAVAVAGAASTCAQAQDGSSQQNNNYFMTYVDADGTSGGNTTFDSSSATVTVPPGATVLYAGLSWGAVTSAGATAGYSALTGVAAPNSALKTSALFQAPGAVGYSPVTSTTTDVFTSNYQAFADVTSTVKAAGSGVYTVANVQAGTGGGNYAGWSLAVAYSVSTMPMRNLVIFTGYNLVQSNTPPVTSPLDIPVSGFTTPATGAVKTTVGVVAYEGDKGSTGDSMSIGSTPLSNSLNPVNDVFNASITDLNVAVTDRNPSYTNTLGFDVDRFDATGALANGSTSTTIHLTTSGDTYYPGLVTFATDLYASALTATKTATDVNGGTLARGDVLRYSITVTNGGGGGDGAAATVLTDAAPVGTTYVAGSLIVGGTAVTDAPDTDTGDVNAGNVTARLGTGADGTAGGLLAPNASSTVTFQVKVNSSVADGSTVSNFASFSSNSQTTGTGTAGASNTVTNAVVVPPSFNSMVLLTATGEVGAAYSSGLALNGGTGTGPYVWSISAGALPGGLSINSSTGLITGTPTTAGTFTPTVLVTDANNRTGFRSQSITIAAGPVVTFTPPGGEAGAAYSAQPTVTGGTSPYTWSVSAGTLPAGLTINASTGLISGTPTSSGTTNVTVQVVDGNSVSATKAVSIVIVAGPALTFAAPPAGEVTVPYSNQLTYSGGVSTYTWSISSGSLPTGLTLNSGTGLITGTPTVAGSSTFTVKIVDGNGLSDTKSATLVIGPGPTVTFVPPAGEVTVAYSAQPTVSGGVGPYTWSVSAGTLPAGLNINASTGLISGTPTAAGTTSITVRAVDANSVPATATASIVITPAPALTFPAPPAGEVSVAYSDQLTFTGGVGPFTWSISTGALPAGLTLNASTGLLSGTPTTAGSFPFTVRIVDANGVADTKPATVVIARSTTTITLSAPASVQFGNPVTLSASVSPTAAGGTVTFTDVPASGAQSGTTVTLGSDTLTGGTASIRLALPAFGVNTITAHYAGDTTHAATDSTTGQVEVSAFAGEVIVTEFRSSGPAGANDSYIELLNTGPTVPLAGIVVSSSSGTTSTLPTNAGLLGTGRSYLITGSAFSLTTVATSDYTTTLGTGGIKLTAPDTALTQTDAVGPGTGFHLGTGLPAMTGTPTAQYAWVRREIAGAAVDTHDNAADFVLVTRQGALVGGVQSTLGSASPTGTADPYQHNAGLTSTLLDPATAVTAPPNRVVVTGGPGTLTVRRTITNTSGATISSAKVRVTALSELHGQPQPGVGTQPAKVANLRVINPAAPTQSIRLSSGSTVTVNNLTVDAPSNPTPGGGLNSTLTLPLPNGGLAPGATIDVAFTFAIDTRGTFWFGYDVDASTVATGNARHASQAAHVSPHATGNIKPGDSGRIR